MSGGSRDLVRFEANERVDLPDMEAVQDNARSESRLATYATVTGGGNNLLGTGSLYATGQRFAIKPFACTTTGTQITVIKGLGYGGVTDPNGVVEYGVTFGLDGDASQTVDMSGKATGTYAVQVRPTFDAGASGTRIFWDAGAAAESASAVDTRKITGWTTLIVLASALDDRALTIGIFAWDLPTTTISTFLEYQFPVYDALYTYAPASGILTVPQEWWNTVALADPSKRDPTTHRAQLTTSLVDFTAVTRGQIATILGKDYWKALPSLLTTVRAGVGGVGDAVSLDMLRDHIDASVDPHGTTCTVGSVSLTCGTFNATGTVTLGNAASTHTVAGTSWTDNSTDTNFMGDVNIHNDIIIHGAGALPSFNSALTTYRAFSPMDMTRVESTSLMTYANDGATVKCKTASPAVNLYLPLNNNWAATASVTGASINSMWVSLSQSIGSGATVHASNWTVIIELQRKNTIWSNSSWTTLFSQGFTDAGIGGSEQVLDLTAYVTALSAAEKLIHYGEVMQLHIKLLPIDSSGTWSAADTDSAWLNGVFVGWESWSLQP